MECVNSPLSVTKPDGWDEILAYTEGGPHPGFTKAQYILDQYLENIMMENCEQRPIVTNSAFRRPGCSVRATDFDEFPGKGISYSGLREEDNIYKYRMQTGMRIVSTTKEPIKKRFAFDNGWDYLALALGTDEFAAYTFSDVHEGDTVRIDFICREDAAISIMQDDHEVARMESAADKQASSLSHSATLRAAAETVVKVRVHRGRIELHVVHCIES